VIKFCREGHGSNSAGACTLQIGTARESQASNDVAPLLATPSKRLLKSQYSSHKGLFTESECSKSFQKWRLDWRSPWSNLALLILPEFGQTTRQMASPANITASSMHSHRRVTNLRIADILRRLLLQTQ
jgi:hypothetical protein